MQTLSAQLPDHAVRPPGLALRLASDERLARWAADGREGAMGAIFERHHQALHRYCHSIVGNSSDAADALQNTMVKALCSLPGETRRVALKPWLYRIAHNESISMLRARRPESDLDAAAHVSDVAATSIVESRERLRDLTADLGELTERQRAALLMRELGGLQFEEVAQALATSSVAVKQSVYEARRALQSMQEGRAMDCEAVRRTLSDGDRRTLRGMRMRGHLRACTGCRDFEAALYRRPEQLAALIPPLPVAAAAAMLHGILGGGAGTGGDGSGLLAGLVGSAKATTTISLGAKAAAVVAVSATLTGGAVYAVPELEGARQEHRGASRQPVTGAGAQAGNSARVSTVSVVRRAVSGGGSRAGTSSRARSAGGGSGSSSGTASALSAGRGKPAGTPGGRPSGTLGKPAGTPGGKPAGTPGAKPSTRSAHKPSGTPGGRSATTPKGKRATTPASGSGRDRTIVVAGGKPATTPASRVPGIPESDSPGLAAAAVPGSGGRGAGARQRPGGR